MKKQIEKIKNYYLENKKTADKILVLVAFVLIFAAGTFFRFWQLDTVPPGMQYDEAYNGLDALKANETGQYKLFYPENNGREGLYINILGLFMKYFGANNFVLRITSALFGSLTLIGFYLLIRQLKISRISSLLGTSMLALSFWHLNFSRIVYRGIMLPFLLVWIFYFFYLGLKKKNYWFFAISGLLTGIGFHTYISYRVAPLIFLILVAGWIFIDRMDFVKKYWKHALVFFFGCLLAAAPIFFYFYQNRADFVGRSNSVSVFNAPELSPVQAIGKSLLYHLGAFVVYGDPNQRHNHNAMPLLPAAWSIMFVIGFFLSLWEIIKTILNRLKKMPATKYFELSLLAQAIFWVMLIGGVLSIEGIPHSLRIIGTIPAAFLIAVIPLEYVLNLRKNIKNSPNLNFKPWRWKILNLSIVGIILIVVASGADQMKLYFSAWAKDIKTVESFEKKVFDLGLAAKQLEKKETNIVITPPDISISSDHRESSLKSTEFAGYGEISKYFFWKPLDALNETTCDNALYLFFEADQWLVKQYEKKCPNLKLDKFKPGGGFYEFWILR